MPFQSKHAGYQPITVGDDSSALPELADDMGETAGFLIEKQTLPEKGITSTRSVAILTFVNIILFLTSSGLFSVWFYNTHVVLNGGLRGHHTYSPVLDRFDLKAKTVTVNGTLYPNKDGGSLARQMPNNASDMIWKEWELTRVIPVTADEIRRMGKDPSTVAKLEDAIWGLGDDAYAAVFDVYHHLHCLNTLRKIAYPGRYGNHTAHVDAGPEGMHEVHLNHCVDILMQALQCSGNVNLITLHWVETQRWPFPDMSVRRRCVDFEGLTRWRLDNGIDMDKYMDVMRTKPAGVKELPAPDLFYKYYMPDRVNPNHLDGANPDNDFNL
ncbi:hypothetical protein GGR56DRAFT_691237 [Xylariaceae sp. FL0804]|nr:hypothetical protein GGR56DRAFT_691237 [Xylariaceae sp. FL0804]